MKKFTTYNELRKNAEELAAKGHGFKIAPKAHNLKLEDQFFWDIRDGRERFEIRKNDRGYMVGDILIFHRFEFGTITSDFIFAEITYISDYAQRDNYVVLGFRVMK